MKRTHVIILIGVVVALILLVVALIPKGKGPVRLDTRVSVVKEARQILDRGNLAEARVLYKKAMAELTDVDELIKIQNTIEGINIKIIFSPSLDECSTLYIVKPKDVLSRIAKRFSTTVNLIKRANNLSSDIIHLGQKLKVNTCIFSVVVDKSQNLLFLKRKGEVMKTYIVSTGKDNKTPIGTFKIVNKLVKPTWYKTGAVISPDSPDNILGSRWMGFDLKGYGIHGTTEPQRLGEQITLGCVRMKNEEIQELFDIIPVGTEIIIID